EFDLKPSEQKLSGLNFRQEFARQHLENPNLFQENVLVHDPYFASLITQLQARIDRARSAEWTNLLQQKLAPFVALHKSKSSVLKAGAESLDEIIEEGKVQHFPLSESPGLYASL